MNKKYFFFLITSIMFPLLIHRQHIDSPSGLIGEVHDFQLTALLFRIFFDVVQIPYRVLQFIMWVRCSRRLAIKYFCRVTG